MSHGLRWPSDLDVNKTTARIVDTFKSGAAHAGPGGFPSASARPDNPARSPNDGSRPLATGNYPLYPLVGLCRAAGLPEPVAEYVFHPTRKWRFDYAIPRLKVAIEIEGGVWTHGRHTRGQGFLDDMQKYNAAAVLGWRILRYPPDRLADAVIDLRRIYVAAAL